MKKVLDKIWSENAEKFMSVVHTSQKNVLHPTLSKLINEQKPNNLLDFGCGDGRILKLISDDTQIDVYDKNEEMIYLAKHNVGNKVSNIYIDLNEIPTHHYESILVSMVLVCIDNEKEYLNVLKKIRTCKTETGKVYIAVSHPCFRDKDFSNYHTSYGREQPFNYLNEGEPFSVFIEDEMPPSIAFTDFHWSLSFTMNKICEAGLIIEKVIETPDDHFHKTPNKLQPTFLIIIAK